MHRTDAFDEKTKEIEILLEGTGRWDPDCGFALVHVPGHTAGSIAVLVDTKAGEMPVPAFGADADADADARMAVTSAAVTERKGEGAGEGEGAGQGEGEGEDTLGSAGWEGKVLFTGEYWQ